jgi:hypothetical protein
MGLDMYLYAREYISAYDWDKNADGQKLTNILGNLNFAPSELESPSVVVQLPIGYWRKANQIHNWFVKNVQGGEDDCKEYHLDRETLQELLDTCEKVLENPSLAEELLPTSSGFFFGSTDYDEYYENDLRETSILLTKILSDTRLSSSSVSFIYTSSW